MKNLNLECDNVGLEWKLRFRSVSYKKDNSLLELTLNFQISFLLHLDEAVHTLCKPLPLSFLMKQLPSCTIGCNIPIALISRNKFKTARLSC